MSGGLQALVAPQEPRLPPLRQDLEIMLSGSSPGGAPSWVLHDPVQHRYFQISHETRELLSVWTEGATIAQWVEAAAERLDLSVDVAICTRLIDFARASHLTLDNAPGSWRTVWKVVEKSRHSLAMTLVHNYLFFRVPLMRPQAALKAALPYVEPLYTWQAVASFSGIGLIGLYLVSRQWTQFVTTFRDAFSLEGLLYFAISLVFVKALHELGHACTAVRYGCHVPTIGVAFIVMAPLLYTDVTDSWRLSNRKQRLLIDAAGILVELGLACLATFLWVFLPDGPARGIAFTTATTSWIMSIVLNSSPFTRFDGYYLLSDLLQVDNLQPRAFALGQWRMRQLLFAPDMKPPEVLPVRLGWILVAYAWTIWLYRLIIFTGIAVLVYHYFFKILGIILFSVEIWFFVARPIVREIMAWPKIGVANVSIVRTAITCSLAAGIALALTVPWSGRIEVPALLTDAEVASVYPVRAAMIESVDAARGDKLTKGAPLVHLTSLELDSAIRSTQIQLALTRARIARSTADQQDRSQLLVLAGELDSNVTKLAGLQTEREQLTVRAPADGVVATLAPHLRAGLWLAKNDLIAVMAGGARLTARGYMSESALARVQPGATGRFVPDDLTRAAISVTLSKVALAGASSIDIAELASVYGGRIGVEPDATQRLAPVGAQYLVEFAVPDATVLPNQTVRGLIELEGSPESFAVALWRQVAKVLVRESGF